jgi:diacylglycerol O-acyltransferase
MRFEDRMSDSDALMWTIEKDPMLRSTIIAIAVLDRAPDRARIEQRMEAATRLVPRLRQRVVGIPLSIAPPRWEVDPNFDLTYHLRWLHLGGQASLRDVLRLAEPIAMQGFDRSRPLWEFYVIEGIDGGQAAVIIKLHHAITDGVGAVRIGMVLFDLERRPKTTPEMPGRPEVNVLGWWARIQDAFDHERRRQLGIASRLPSMVASATARLARNPAQALSEVADTIRSAGRMLTPAGIPASPVMTGRSLSVHFDTVSLPLEETKTAARVAGCRLNDAFVAGVLGGFQRYHAHHGLPIGALRMTMPINIRDEETEDLAGNNFAPARFMVPLDIEHPVQRMQQVRRLVETQRAEPSLGLLEPMAAIVYRLPTSVSTALFQAMLKGVDLVTSNVPGVAVPVFFAGGRVVSQFGFGPMTGSAANLTLLSYCDQVHIGVNTDRAAIPDSDVFVACLEDSFDEIRKLA